MCGARAFKFWHGKMELLVLYPSPIPLPLQNMYEGDQQWDAMGGRNQQWDAICGRRVAEFVARELLLSASSIRGSSSPLLAHAGRWSGSSSEPSPTTSPTTSESKGFLGTRLGLRSVFDYFPRYLVLHYTIAMWERARVPPSSPVSSDST